MTRAPRGGAVRPDVEVMLREAVAHHQAGRLDVAERGYRVVLAHRPDHAHASFLLGNIALQTGHADAAADLFRSAIRHGGRRPDYLVCLGNAHLAGKRPADALASYEACLALNPDQPEVRFNRACALRDLGSPDAAIDECRAVVAARPAYAPARLELARLLAASGATDDAVTVLRPLAGTDSPDRGAQILLAGLFTEREQFAEARGQWEQLAARYPADAAIRNDLAVARQRAGDSAGAIAALREAVKLDPARFEAQLNLGVRLRESGALAEARDHLHAAHRLQPDSARALHSLANVTRDLGDLDGAIALLRRAVAVDPDAVEIGNALSHTLLCAGAYAEGWARHPDKWRDPALAGVLARYPQPRWAGEPLSGRCILVWSEQGLGDQIMFASTFPDLKELAGRCAFECDPRLVPLFARSFPWARVIPAGTPADPAIASADIDFQCPMSGVPRWLRTQESAFPRHRGYLRADPARIAYWRARLDALGDGPKVGISWRGGVTDTRIEQRSIPLDAWSALLALPGVRFVSLQYTECSAERAEFLSRYGIDLPHWQDAIDVFDETAALVAALDLVVSVCTTVIHLAGALAIPTRVLVPEPPGWRYRASGDTMPWYPSVQLLRQHRHGDWSRPLAQAASAIRTVTG
jgi:tetratricopeptide (TPR) repeat protein